MEIKMKLSRVKPSEKSTIKLLQEKEVAYVDVIGDKDLVDSVINTLKSYENWEIE
jgi:hypothetical protein